MGDFDLLGDGAPFRHCGTPHFGTAALLESLCILFRHVCRVRSLIYFLACFFVFSNPPDIHDRRDFEDRYFLDALYYLEESECVSGVGVCGFPAAPLALAGANGFTVVSNLVSSRKTVFSLIVDLYCSRWALALKSGLPSMLVIC